MVPPRRLIATLLVAAMTLALTAPSASAHTELTSTSPKAGSYAKNTLSTVRARFNQPIRSGRLVVERAGEKVSIGSGRRSPGNVRAIETRMPDDLAAGTYTARWTMTASDGHVQRGSWRFKIRAAPAATEEATPTPTATASPSAEPTTSPDPTATVQPASASDDGGGGTWLLVGGLVLVGALAAGGVVFARRRSPS
jgi:copper resistance protein C